MRIEGFSFLASFLMHGIFLVVLSMQYREQLEHLFLVDIPKSIEQKVCFVPVVAPLNSEKQQGSNLRVSNKNESALAQKSSASVTKTEVVIKKNDVAAEKEREQQKDEVQKGEVSLRKTEAAPEALLPLKKKKYTHKDLLAAQQRNQIRKQQEQQREKFLSISRALKAEIALHWHPPICEQEVLESKVSLTLSPKGYLENAEILESSSVMAYDISILRAVKKMHFIEDVWGKRFLILFKK